MKHYITVDGGTTNTRLYLVREDGQILGERRLAIGARLGGSEPARYRGEIGGAIRALCEETKVRADGIERILASGMITSELGLCPLPHASAPAGIAELHGAMHETVLSDISEIPFVFLRGVKTESDDLSEVDMMRGEETELMGLSDEPIPSCLYVLPGSHSKLISTDEKGRIAHFTTTLTGEMLSALSAHTILSDTLKLCDEAREGDLLAGYHYAAEHGLSEALFKTRILSRLLGADDVAAYSFFLGAVLESEIGQILKSPAKSVLLAGKRQLRLAMAAILRAVSDKQILLADEASVMRSTARGALRIYRGY